MKKFFLFIGAFLVLSCEDVVDVDLGTTTPQLVVDASIKWEKGTSGNEQEIRLSMTAPYFADEIPAASGATVSIVAENGTVFPFEELTAGRYVTDSFMPELNMGYTLLIMYEGISYSATEILKPVPEITDTVQNNNGGFTGDAIEVRAFFTDDAASNDYYLLRFKPDYNSIPYYEVIEDRFFQGNEIFALYSDGETQSGDEIAISVSGISQRYYNYMNILTTIAGSNGGSPFQTPPAEVLGNVTGQNNERALGYFSLSEVSSVVYQVE